MNSDTDLQKTKSDLEELCRRVSDASDEPSVLAALGALTAYLAEHNEKRTADNSGKQPPIFDIFRGHPLDRDAVWVAAVRGLAAAHDTMEALAKGEAGPYFIFFSGERTIVDALDTTEQPVRDKVPGVA